MATEVTKDQLAGPRPAARTATASSSFADDLVLAIPRALASLKLTVTLFTLSMILVFAGTLAQVESDIWDVMNNYFRCFFAFVPFNTFFPYPWGPEIHESIPEWAGFWFPGGYTIGLLMAVNLLAAHGIRFKIQASGIRLVIGCAVMVIGVTALLIVIFSGNASGSLQGIPSFGLSPVWLISKIVLVLGSLAVAAGCGYLVYRMLASNGTQSLGKVTVFGAVGVLHIAFLLWLLISGFEPDPAALRILWQLFTSTIASIILLAGCIVVFKKRGGIVLIHAGIGLLMGYEAYVSLSAVEERIVLTEGQTSNYAFDVRETEVAFVLPAKHEEGADTEQARVIAIPTEKLLSGERFSHPDLPVDIQVRQFFRNSDLTSTKKAPVTATKGFGEYFGAEADTTSTGVSMGGVDIASMYVDFYPKPRPNAPPASLKRYAKGETYLLSQWHSEGYLPQFLQPADLASLRKAGLKDDYDELTVDGKTYEVALRFKRTYKPYRVTLLDVRKEDYVGTNTPKNYSSDLRLVEPDKDVDMIVHSRMNNPTRYGGETFYQSNWAVITKDGQPIEQTTLQVVTNEGWMVPYLCCMMVWVGLLAHFIWVMLLPFLNIGRQAANQRSQQPLRSSDGIIHAPATPAAPTAPQLEQALDAPILQPTPLWLKLAGIIVPVFFALITLAFFGRAAVAPFRPMDSEYKVDQFGALPVAMGGRKMPYDSVARQDLKGLTYGYSTYESKVGGKKPAILWLLDVISHADDAEEHRVFYIPNEEVRSQLGLAGRKGYKYALGEFANKIETIRDEAKRASDVDAQNRSTFERKIIDLHEMVQLYFGLRESHRIPDVRGLDSPLDEVGYMLQFASLTSDISGASVPHGIKWGTGDNDWEPLVVAAGRNWIKAYAKEKGAKSLEELADMLNREVLKERVLLQIEQVAKDVNPDMPADQLRLRAEQVYATFPAEQRERMLASEFREETAADIYGAAHTLLGDDAITDPQDESTAEFVAMLRAYKEEDPDAFNKHLAAYTKTVKLDPETASDVSKEVYFNAFEPFYLCMVMYIAAGLLSLLAVLAAVISFFSGGEYHRPLIRAVLAMVVITFMVHTLGLWARVDISGRPPVTNLYSSALFIGWAGVAFGIGIEFFYRIGVGNLIAVVIGGSTLLIATFLGMTGDTMGVLQAVLDTQFWLATHVICITLGYSATFVAGATGVFYLFGGTVAGLLRSMFPPASEQGRHNTDLALNTIDKILFTMLYGTVCFALLLSFVGTVLGGLWADDSWGRFWGWDPKENGALMIVIWNSLILHARWDKLVSGRGMAVLVVAGNIVTAWSWFGVNLLGVGLHSYGFTENGLFYLGLFVLSQLGVIAFGLLPTPMWAKKSVLFGD